ncbi:hypothetical protein ACFQNE_02010 [Gordonia phosphorivorans]|uniref:Portal protein n=1 Tax=Gordonia phosphorivorans TaxID=1056982 RepID=A0ABV6H6K6_9ACTN
MADEDGRVTSLLEAIKLPILRTPWRIDPAGADPAVVDFIAANLGLPVVGASDEADDRDTATAMPRGRRRQGRFSWRTHLAEVLTMLEFGHAYFEQVYRYDPEARQFWLRKLAPRPQATISKINVARDGGLESIEQAPPGWNGLAPSALAEVKIPVSRLVAYVRHGGSGNWIGKSLLRPVHKNWLLKDDILRVQATAIRRGGAGIPVVTCAKDDDKQVERAQQLASNMRAGNFAGLGLPPGWKAELIGVQGNLPDPQRAIESHDRAIALAGLAHFLNLDGRGGSYALASVQADTFVQALQAVAEQIAEISTEHIVYDLVDLNFGTDVAAPRIVFDEIGTRQDATAAALKMLVDSGLLVPDPGTEHAIRQNLGLPSAAGADAGDDTADSAPAVTVPSVGAAS